MSQDNNFTYDTAINGLQGKPGEPAGLPIFVKKIPVFHRFIVFCPYVLKIYFRLTKNYHVAPSNILTLVENPRIILMTGNVELTEFQNVSAHNYKNKTLDYMGFFRLSNEFYID